MPEVEYWTYGAVPEPGRIGINLGAPGDRRAESGTLWLEHPVVGGPSPPVPVSVRLKNPRYFLHHASRICEGSLSDLDSKKLISPLQNSLKIMISQPPQGRFLKCTVEKLGISVYTHNDHRNGEELFRQRKGGIVS